MVRRRLALLGCGLLLAPWLTACSGSGGGGTGGGAPVTDDTTLTIAIDLKHAEHSDDSNTTIQELRLEDDAVRFHERHSGAHAGEPTQRERSLDAATEAEVRKLAVALLAAASKQGDMDLGESDYYYVVTEAKVALTVGAEQNTFTLKGITNLAKQDPPFAEDPTLKQVEKLASLLERATQPD